MPGVPPAAAGSTKDTTAMLMSCCSAKEAVQSAMIEQMIVQECVQARCAARTGVPAASSIADSPKAVPTHSVCTAGFMYFMVS